MNFAAQLYTLRQHTQTAQDLSTTLKKVKKIGYPAVQISAIGKIDPKDVAKMLQDEGLTCCATHTPMDRLQNDTAKVIEEHHLWNCQYTALGGFFPPNPTANIWKQFITDFNAIAKKFVGSGISLGYHNHSHELFRFDRTTALDLLIQNCDPTIWFELDTYWIAFAGADPAAWITKVANRIPCVHLKDMGVKPGPPKSLPEQFMMEVGEGNLNWPNILKACQRANVQWFIVEQDECYRDPFDSLALSLQNLQQLSVSHV